MVPKKIHYCWFGNNPKPSIVEQCIESWRKACPDFEIIEWNELNSPIHQNAFVEEALQEKKWAFVSDYVRLWALYEYGGVYCDTDVEILQSINVFLNEGGFLGYADDIYINPALIGFAPKNKLCKKFLDYYEDKHFLLPDGRYNDTPNNIIYTNICINELNMIPGDNYIKYGKVAVFPTSFFAPFKKNILGKAEKQYSHDNFIINKNTYAIHYATYSWSADKITDLSLLFTQILRKVLPAKVFMQLKKVIIYHRIKKQRNNNDR